MNTVQRVLIRDINMGETGGIKRIKESKSTVEDLVRNIDRHVNNI